MQCGQPPAAKRRLKANGKTTAATASGCSPVADRANWTPNTPKAFQETGAAQAAYESCAVQEAGGKRRCGMRNARKAKQTQHKTSRKQCKPRNAVQATRSKHPLGAAFEKPGRKKQNASLEQAITFIQKLLYGAGLPGCARADVSDGRLSLHQVSRCPLPGRACLNMDRAHYTTSKKLRACCNPARFRLSASVTSLEAAKGSREEETFVIELKCPKSRSHVASEITRCEEKQRCLPITRPRCGGNDLV